MRNKFSTDTFYPQTKSFNQNTAAQIYSHKNGFSVCYPITGDTGQKIGETLNQFIHDFSVPERLISDGAGAQVGKNTLFQELVRKHHIDHHVSEPRRPNGNSGGIQKNHLGNLDIHDHFQED